LFHDYRSAEGIETAITLKLEVYLCIVNLVLMQDLITQLLIHMSQRQSAVE